MANTTVRGAFSVHGTNPQYLIEKVIRTRIYDTLYWKEHCFALNSASIIDRACELTYIGGTYANQKPTEFMCLALKLLQLQPEREIILEYLRADEFKYLRALAAFYVRLTFDPLNAYEVLEPLLDDYRKLRVRAMDGSYSITTMDEFADSLLNEERVCEIQLPRLTQRKVLEETEGLPSRKSKLGKAMGVLGTGNNLDGESDDGGSDGEDVEGEGGRYLSRSPSGSRSPTPEKSPTPEYWTEGSEDEEGEDVEGDVKMKVKKRVKSKIIVEVDRGNGAGVETINRDDSDDDGADGRYISPSPDRSERFVSKSPSRSP